MIDREINEFVRLVGSVSLNEKGKQRIADFLNNSLPNRKEFPVKYVAVASAVAVLAVGTLILTQNSKQNLNIR